MATINGNANNNVLNGTIYADTIRGAGGNDTISGKAGNDYLYGDSGGDTLYGDAGNDRLWGGTGIDALWGGDGDDQMYGEGGNDYMKGGLGADYLHGGSNDDRLRGDEGNDTLHDGGGNDDLQGGAGNDTLIHFDNNTSAITGAARYDGGTGLDRFVLSTDHSGWNWSYIDLTGAGSSEVNATAGLQSDIENEDYWEREQAGTITNVEVFEASRNQKLYFEGGGGDGYGHHDITIKGSNVGNFIGLGQDNETVQCGNASDTVVIGGFAIDDAHSLTLGRDRIVGFDPAEDAILTGMGGDGSRIDVRETSGQTVITGYVTHDDGFEQAVNIVTIDAVGVNIGTEWFPV